MIGFTSSDFKARVCVFSPVKITTQAPVYFHFSMSLPKTAIATVFWIRANGQSGDIYTVDTEQAFLTTASQGGGLRMLQPLVPDISTDVLYSAVVHGVPRNTAFSYYTNGNLNFGSPSVAQTGYLMYLSLSALAPVQASVQINSPGVGIVSLVPSADAPAAPNGWSIQFSNGQVYLSFNPTALASGETPMLPVVSVLFGQPTNIEIIKMTNLRPPPLASIAKGLQLQCVLADASGNRLEPVIASGSRKRYAPATSPASAPATLGWAIGLYTGIGGLVLVAAVLAAVFLSKRKSEEL